MTGKHARPAEPTLFKTMATFFATIMPFLVLPFLILSEFISISDDRPLYVRFPHEDPVLSRYSPNKLPAGTEIGYSRYVADAMKEMGFMLDHFGVWASEHEGSVLPYIKYMPETMQKDVANIALFIRKSNFRIDAKTAWREAAALVHYSAKYGLPSALTTAVAHAESTFNPNAMSSKGAAGVMQVVWRIHNGLLQSNGIRATPGSNPLSDPEHAIAAGCLLLSRYVRASGSVQKAMDRYYGGPSAGYQRKINGNIAKLMIHKASHFD